MVKMMTLCMNTPTKNILPAPTPSSMALPPNPTTALATPATTKKSRAISSPASHRHC